MEGSAVVLERDVGGLFLRDHCFAAGKSHADPAWMGVDYRWGSTRVWCRYEFRDLLECADFPENRVAVLWNPGWPFYGRKPGLPAFTCVQSVKSLLGIDRPMVQSVRALEEVLVDGCGFRSFSPETCDILGAGG